MGTGRIEADGTKEAGSELLYVFFIETKTFRFEWASVEDYI